MSVDIQVKYGDERDWTITLSDTTDTKINLSSAAVAFQLRKDEGAADTFFVRNTAGTGADYIEITSPATSGIVTITPTASDWTDISDYGIYVGEFKITDSNSVVQYTKDVVIHIQEALI